MLTMMIQCYCIYQRKNRHTPCTKCKCTLPITTQWTVWHQLANKNSMGHGNIAIT